MLRNRVAVHRQQINHSELRQTELSHHLEICEKIRNSTSISVPKKVLKIKSENEHKRTTMDYNTSNP